MPDLFIFAFDKETNEIDHCRFVEVKKPEEPLSQVQKVEIVFLRSLNLKAGVFRLIEARERIATLAKGA